jgi:hypothetical protein
MLENTPSALEATLNASPLTFPILEVTHIASFAIAIGTIALVDFRLLGLAMLRQTPGKLASATRLWTLLGLSTAIFSGSLMYATDPDKFYLNVSFLFKIACLILAITFHYTVHRRVVLGVVQGVVQGVAGAVPSAKPAGAAIATACLSLALWMGVVFGGIFIEFVKEGLSFS